MSKSIYKASGKSFSIVSKLIDVFSRKKIDAESVKKIYNSMIESDIGPETSSKLICEIEKLNDLDSALAKLKSCTLDILSASNQNFLKEKLIRGKLNIILMIGINGSGKTTNTGKLSYLLAEKGFKTCVAACDTFRAAAEEQLVRTCKNINCKVIRSTGKNKDPASVAYDAVTSCIDDNLDVLIIDTAGRVHTQENLMNELTKIVKVVNKAAGDSNVIGLLTIDGSVGQNSINQVKEFSKKAKIDGLIVTKLDSSSKGGVIINIVDNYKIPVFFICNGEEIDNISKFDSKSFVDSIFEV